MDNVLDNYISSEPNPQNALDIFPGQWTSKLPAPWDSLNAGPLPLFEDIKIDWAIEQFGGIQGKSVCELGPLEGGNSYMLERAGAKSVLAIEANTRAFLRCLIVKEILGLKKVQFMCGDFRPFLQSNQQAFDVILASGVLYHMTDPMRLLFDISRHAPQCYLWTHYFEPDFIASNQVLRGRLGPAQQMELDGFRYVQHRHNYSQTQLSCQGFCGGTHQFSTWLPRDTILSALRYFGFTDIRIAFDQPDHPNGPSLAVVAQRK
jgi:hypothetical protein